MLDLSYNLIAFLESRTKQHGPDRYGPFVLVVWLFSEIISIGNDYWASRRFMKDGKNSLVNADLAFKPSSRELTQS